MTPSDVFDLALAFTFKSEGGLVNEPDDHGGKTNYGITQKTYTSWRQRKGLAVQDVSEITLFQARQIYREDYWLTPHFDQLVDAELPKLAIALFDFGVNAGPGKATQVLQSLVGASPDGFLGAKTISRCMTMGAALSDSGLALQYNVQRVNWYKAHTQAKFINGWLNRVHDLSSYLASLKILIPA